MSRSSLPNFRDEQAERNDKKDPGVRRHGKCYCGDFWDLLSIWFFFFCYRKIDVHKESKREQNGGWTFFGSTNASRICLSLSAIPAIVRVTGVPEAYLVHKLTLFFIAVLILKREQNNNF